jgi:hypothetical protein
MSNEMNRAGNVLIADGDPSALCCKNRQIQALEESEILIETDSR